MFCPKCGKQLPEGELSCPDCSTGFQKMMNKSPYAKLAKASSNAMEKIVNGPAPKPAQPKLAESAPAQPKQIQPAPAQPAPAPAPVQPNNVQPVENEPVNKAKGFAIAGFIFAFINSFIGLILSAVGLGKYKKQENKKLKGLAIAGLIISLLKFLGTAIISCVSGFIIVLLLMLGILGSGLGFGDVVYNDVNVYTYYNQSEVTFYVSEYSYDWEEVYSINGEDYYSDTETLEFNLAPENYGVCYIKFTVTNNEYSEYIYPSYYFRSYGLDDYYIEESSDWSYAENYGLGPNESASVVIMLDFNVDYDSNHFTLEVLADTY